ncbi:MAG: histidine--tRNA ligase [Gemmatimonadales bacterium]|nr:histidine--tRNA ligase [Gemmatimonadales bacterium]
MNIKFRRLKGTRDILLEEVERWRWCEDRWAEVLARYGYGEIRTPIIEPTALFLRSVGQGTDIVDKEMYTFESKGGDSLTLRPEMTASVVRAYLENGLTRQPGTMKFYYMGPMFRHDRPQAGRYRQFHQIGVEAIGSPSPVLDAEVIHTAMALFDAVDAQGLTVSVNSIGCPECRPAYVDDLKKFLNDNLDRIPPPMQARLDINPLRLFDAKDEGVQELLAGFKPISSMLCGSCKEHFQTVRGTLDEMEVPNQEDPSLVRGLDYYCRTTFEIKAQAGRKTSSLAGGGRYDYLVEQCGGPATPAVGFSIGIERTLLHLNDDPIDPQRSRQSKVDVYVACRGDGAERYGLVASDLLRGFCRLEVDTSGRSLKAQAKSANLRGAKILLIVGQEELATGSLQMKNLENGEQNPVDRGELLAVVRKALEG